MSTFTYEEKSGVSFVIYYLSIVSKYERDIEDN